MAKFTEQTLTNWTKPPSDTEESKLENAERMVREAISEDETLKSKSTETFGQGSYANNTNVKNNSDIDINVRYTGGFYFNLPPNTEQKDVGLDKLSGSSYSYSEFKDNVETALVNKFGRGDVVRNDKCITVKENSSRVETDVVPTWNYRRYSENGNYVLGSKFMTDSYNWVINYPEQHIENGVDKNKKTSRRFKRLTRLHKKIRYQMIDDNLTVNSNIKSFLLECLVWNVPNNIFDDYNTWNERLKQSIIFLYQNTKEQETSNEWGEVSELIYLIRDSRKWTRKDINDYLLQLWNYLEY
jgi:hypothetical protein